MGVNPEKIKLLHQKARALPLEPGVYLMKDQKGEIIYIGKAKLLRNRVSSYFRALDKHTPKVLGMVEHVDHFDTIITGSEFEALVLECSLIKQHTPKYNILLKDDKGYSYMRIDNSDYPRITEVKQKLDDGARYIGPYMSGWVVKQTVDEANKAFQLPTCNRNFPADFGKGRPCLNFHIKQCMGLCRGRISKEEYRETLEQAVDFIRGGGGANAIAVIRQKMEEAAENLEFEKAARLRDRINAINRFSEKQRVVYVNVADQDVLAFVQGASDISAAIIKFRGEKLVDKASFLLRGSTDAEEARGEFISRYYTDPAHALPPQLTVDGEVPDHDLIERMLTERAGRKVTIFRPQRGEAVRLVEMAKNNAAELLAEQVQRTGKEISALDELGSLLGLSAPPSYIESYDISNIGSDVFVGAMVVFEDGRPLKKAYKRFSMRGVEKPDDYACMAQMLERRLTRLLAQEEDGGSFNRRPDLLLTDGGRGHVATVRRVTERLGLDIPVFGMVKDDRHRTRAITSDGAEISISSKRSVFTLITNIQDETHRFAVTYSRKKHQKSGFELAIRNIGGIGPARAKALYNHFKTQKRMYAASAEELASVKGMTRTAAENLYRALHPQGLECGPDSENAEDDENS